MSAQAWDTETPAVPANRPEAAADAFPYATVPGPDHEAIVLAHLAAALPGLETRHAVSISGEAVGAAAAFGKMFAFDGLWLDRAIGFLDLACIRRHRKRRRPGPISGFFLSPSQVHCTAMVGPADVVGAVADETGLDVAATIEIWADRFRYELRKRLDADSRVFAELAHLCVNVKMGARSPFGLGGMMLLCGADSDVLECAAQAVHAALGNNNAAPVLNLATLASQDSARNAISPAASLLHLIADTGVSRPHVLVLTHLEQVDPGAADALADHLRIADAPNATRQPSPLRNSIIVKTFKTPPGADAMNALSTRFGESYLHRLGNPRTLSVT